MPTLTGLTTNFFATPNEGFTTTTSAPVDSSSATVVPFNSVSGLTNGSIFTGLIDPGNAKERAFTGVVDTGGSQITSVKFTTGTNATHTTGATIVDYVTGTHIGAMSKGILIHSDQDGTLKTGAVDNAAVLASDVVTTAKILDSNVTTAKIATDAVTATKIDWASTGVDAGIWWEELGRNTLSVAGDTLSVTPIAARKYLLVKINTIATGGTTSTQIRFNNDSTNNYALRVSSDFAAATTATSQSSILPRGADANHNDITMFIDNITAQEKLVNIINVNGGTAGAGNLPSSSFSFAKWANTSAQITRIDAVNSGTGDFAIGSEIVVLGHN